MFIQITEPLETKSNLQEDQDIAIAIGIDLGTTHSVVSYMDENNKIQLIPINGNVLVPSVVFKDYVGQDALKEYNKISNAEKNSAVLYSSTKRLFDHPNDPLFSSSEKDIIETPVTIASKILSYLKENAEKFLNHSVSKAVITVPAYFDELARQATKKAAALAGLEVLRLINEPTAAALAYGLQTNDKGIYAIYDLGGGTFDFSLLNLHEGIFQVIGTGGDTHLGGDDIDHAIVNLWQKKGFFDLSSLELNKNVYLNAARSLKEKISSCLLENNNNQDFSMTCDVKPFASQQHQLSDLSLILSRKDLNTLTESLIEKTMDVCRDVLKNADVKIKDIQGLILVGGATRLELVRSSVASFFKNNPLMTINPDTIVAMGAGHQAHALTKKSDVLLLDVNPLSLGIETMGGVAECIIPRNTPIPCRFAQDFTNYMDYQTQMMIHIVQGERDLVKDCRSLGQFILKNIPPLLAHHARIRVIFQLDVDGLLTVSAVEQTTGISQSVEINPIYNLSDQELKEKIIEGYEHARQDMEERLFQQAQLEAEQLLHEIQVTIKDLNYTPSDLPEINEMTENLWSLLQSLQTSLVNDHVSYRQQLKEYIQKLGVLCEPLAQERIKKALKE